jgi:hypothetical protein
MTHKVYATEYSGFVNVLIRSMYTLFSRQYFPMLFLHAEYQLTINERKPKEDRKGGKTNDISQKVKRGRESVSPGRHRLLFLR